MAEPRPIQDFFRKPTLDETVGGLPLVEPNILQTAASSVASGLQSIEDFLFGSSPRNPADQEVAEVTGLPLLISRIAARAEPRPSSSVLDTPLDVFNNRNRFTDGDLPLLLSFVPLGKNFGKNRFKAKRGFVGEKTTALSAKDIVHAGPREAARTRVSNLLGEAGETGMQNFNASIEDIHFTANKILDLSSLPARKADTVANLIGGDPRLREELMRKGFDAVSYPNFGEGGKRNSILLLDPRKANIQVMGTQKFRGRPSGATGTKATAQLELDVANEILAEQIALEKTWGVLPPKGKKETDRVAMLQGAKVQAEAGVTLDRAINSTFNKHEQRAMLKNMKQEEIVDEFISELDDVARFDNDALPEFIQENEKKIRQFGLTNRIIDNYGEVAENILSRSASNLVKKKKP